MGLFKKKNLKELSELPRLPKLPELPNDLEFKKALPQLPEYSTTDLNNKFSQNTIKDEQKTNDFLTNSSGSRIKEVISGKKEEMYGADEFAREQMMPEQEIKPSKLEFPYKMERPSKDLELRSWQESSDFTKVPGRSDFERGRELKTKKGGQVFIKIEKFEESLKIFELTKNKIIEMERMLEDIKKLKEKEERELSYWMAEIQTIKNQTEKIEKDIFSKLE